jgi:hypothetical protein
VLYSCTFSSYDWTFSPLVPTPGMRFVRFIDRRPRLTRHWDYAPMPAGPELTTQTLTNRFCKLFPRKLFPGAPVAVYVDGNILVKSDLRPLLAEFAASGADVALFAHPSGRTVAEEIDFALSVGRIPQAARTAAEAQRAAYAAGGVLDTPITENSILFWNLASPRLEAIGAAWWRELAAYTLRDQISLPAVLRETRPVVHRWNWHFADGTNPYFARYPHRAKTALAQARQAVYFLKDYRAGYALAFRAAKAAGRVRRGLGFGAAQPGED